MVESLDWPAGEGYFWMAGESAQMRAIRRYLMRVRRLPATAYDVMGYWRGGVGGVSRAPSTPARSGPRARRPGKSDEEIWAAYDEAQNA